MQFKFPAILFGTLLHLMQVSAGFSQDIDLSRLVHPEVAERLSLSDTQRAQFQELILQRAEQLAAAEDEATRSAIREQFNGLASAELTEEQTERLASDAPAEKLMFQFRDVKWDQVLAWFAEQQDLTLIMDRIPPGSFTYSDTRSYSPSQAIDLLNSVLMTRGFTLVRRERMLVVMELNESIPVELLPQIEIEQLPSRGRFELVSVVFPLDGRPVDAVIGEVKPYLNSYGRILPLARGSQVLVIENAGKMQMINELIASVPTARPAEKISPPPVPVFAAYSIGTLEPSKAEQAIRRLIPSENISVDFDTKVLSAYVIPSQQMAIKAALDAMLEKRSEMPEMQAVAYNLKGMTEEDFRSQVVAIAPSARIMTTTDRALVVASPEDHPLIKQSLVALEILPVDSGTEVRSFKVTSARVSSIVTALQSLVPNSQVIGDSVGGSVIVKGSLEDLRSSEELVQLWSRSLDRVEMRIYALTERQQLRRTSLGNLPEELVDIKFQDGNGDSELLVWGTENQHQMFAEFLSQLDQPTIPKEVNVPQVYPLEVKDSELIVELLKAEFEKAKFSLNADGLELTAIADEVNQEKIQARIAELHERLPARPELSMVIYQLAGTTAASLQQALASEIEGLKVQVDTQQDRLLIWADPERHERISAFMAVLNEEPPVGQKRIVVVYPVQNASATSVKSVLDQLGGTASVVADDKLKQLVVTATIAEHSTLQTIIGQIDRPKSSESSPLVQAYDVQPLQASQVLPMLQTLWPDMTLSADTTSNKIIASGTSEELKQFSLAVERMLDTSDGEQQLVKTYPIPYGDMVSLPAILTQVAPKSIVSSDIPSRTITVLASEEQHERVGQALEQMITTAQSAKQAVSYAVKQTQLTSIQSSLRTLFPTISFSADTVTGQLIVLASQAEHEVVSKVVELLVSGPNAEDKTLKVFKLDPKVVSSAEFMRTLQTLIPPLVTLELSPQTDSILAVGTTEDLAAVTETVDSLLKQWPAPDELTSAVYTLKYAATTTAIAILLPLVPKATIVHDPAARTIAATANPEDHQRIEELLKLLDLPMESNQYTKIYRLNQGTGQAVAYVLAAIMPDARLFGDPNSGNLLATATEKQHEVIQAIADEYGGLVKDQESRVISLRRADAYNLQFTIPSWNNRVKAAADRTSNSLIVTGSPDDLDSIEELISQVDGSAQGDQVTRFYLVDNANPTTLSSALQSNFPKATIAGDVTGGGVFVTAVEEQQAEIQKLIESLNAQPSRMPSLQAFPIQHVSPAVLVRSLNDAYGPRTAARVTFNEDTKTLFVIGTREELKMAERLVELIDVAESSREPRQVRVFPVTGLDGQSVVETLETALQDESDQVDMRFDSLGGRLYIFGTEQQLTRVAKLIESFTPEPRTLQVLPLGTLEPYLAKEAIDSLFNDTPFSQSPLITVDQDRQQMLVKATEEQLQQIRSLLVQMGAPASLLNSGGVGPTQQAERMLGVNRVRVIPMQFNSRRVLDELERVWPQFRTNPLRVLNPREGVRGLDSDVEPAPGERQAVEIGPVPELDSHESVNQPAEKDPLNGLPQNNDLQNTVPPVRGPAITEPEESEVSEADENDDLAAVSSQEAIPERARPSTERSPSDEVQLPAQERPMQDTPQDSASGAPVIIVVGEDAWTLASDDIQALDQLQEILELIRSPRAEPAISTGNYSLYLLKRASAPEMQTMLTELLRPTDTRGSRFSSSMSDLYRRVKIVADNRTNALIVSGTSNDRRLIEELLGVLDSEELMGSLQQLTPTSIALSSATVQQVYTILREIYRSQLTTSVQRRPLPIPEGVSAEVATLLQQLNAQASSPVLAITTDEVTNSLIVRAPPDLTAEIQRFVVSLDGQTAVTPSRRVEVIRLESASAGSIERALRRLLSR